MRIHPTVFILICLLFATHLGADLYRGKSQVLLEKNGLRSSISNSKTAEHENLIITQPIPGTILTTSTLLVRGNATGKNILGVEISLNGGNWNSALGIETWQYTFTNCLNGNHTLKVRIINTTGIGKEKTCAFTISKSAPWVRIISGPTNSLVTNQTFNITLGVNENNGYWKTNSGVYQVFSSLTNPVLTIKTNTALSYYGKDIPGNMSKTQTIHFYWPSSGLNFLLADGKYEVKAGTATNGLINIPSSYFGLPVTILSSNAFYYCRSISGVNMPNSITSIGKLAFARCTNITTINLPNSLTNLGESSFYQCLNICSINLPVSIKKIPYGVFRNCRNITNISLPETLSVISNYVFYGCTSLKAINLPNSATNLGHNIFNGCVNLRSVKLPADLRRIPDQIFSFCNSLTNFALPEKIQSIGNGAFSACVNIQAILIPPGVTNIGSSSFSGCTNLENPIFPDSLFSVGTSAYLGCKKISQITVPSSIKSIGMTAFYSCTALTNLTISSTNPPLLGGAAFGDCHPSLKIHVPSPTAASNYKIAPGWSTYASRIVSP